MSPVRLVCDSTADLEPGYAAAHDVAVVPLRVIFGEEAFRDSVDLQPVEFYRRMRTDSNHPRTSQPTPHEFEEVFRRLGDTSDPIVCTTVSADMSGTNSSARQARDALPDLDIRIHDSRSAGPGHNAAVVAAVAVRDAGGDAGAIVDALERLRQTQRLVFTVETLEYLRRGGRIGGARALLGTVLNIKPILAIVDGKVEALDRVRTYQRALDRLVEEVAISSREWGGATVIVCHADCAERARTVAARVAQVTGEQARVIEVGPVIGCHGGPGAFGLTFHAPDITSRVNRQQLGGGNASPPRQTQAWSERCGSLQTWPTDQYLFGRSTNQAIEL